MVKEYKLNPESGFPFFKTSGIATQKGEDWKIMPATYDQKVQAAINSKILLVREKE